MEDKKQTTIYITKEDEKRINDLWYIRSSRPKRPSRSDVISEALKELHDKEVPKQ